MIVKLSDSIVSPLGNGTEANYLAVKEGRSGLRRYTSDMRHYAGDPVHCSNGSEHAADALENGAGNSLHYAKPWHSLEPFVASLFDSETLAEEMRALQLEAYTPFEQVLIASIRGALEKLCHNAAHDGAARRDAVRNEARTTEDVPFDASSPKVVFVFSTTKGNVYLLDENVSGFSKERVLLGVAARKVCDYFGNPNPPVVVSNACISGLCAQIEAMRLLEGGYYDYAVVAGADMQSPFIVSGFQSFKALSDEPCRPFDAERKGLNLGEAAACIIYARRDKAQPEEWVACRGAIRNDANHISGPSREGEGSYRALKAVLAGFDTGRLAFVNAHGTATAYNDEMESIAVTRAGLAEVPVNGLKGHFGHTMGAAGVLESILSMRALDDHCILGTKGFAHCGVSRPLRLDAQHQPTEKRAFVKLLSGFGGCNAALLFAKGGESCC